MKKIISILLALGLVLGLTVMAVPTTAQPPCATVTATVPPFCAGGTDTYNIAIASFPASLLAANDKLSVEFGAGTTFGTFLTGDITVNAVNVDVTKVVKTDSKLVFPTPISITAGATVTIVIAKVINPVVDGPYTLCLDYQLSCCDPEVFCCVTYNIAPAVSEYDFSFDFSPTYPGLKAGYVPPFKACGQNDSGEDFDTVYNASMDAWLTQFDLNLITTIVGCLTPCANVTVTVGLVTAAAGSTVTMQIDGTWIQLDLDSATPIPDAANIDVVTLTTNMTETWPSLIHVDKVGDYVICFYADCGAPPPCSEGGGIIAEECMEFYAYQWKDAAMITLDEKWNLISLPLAPFDTDVDAVLAPLAVAPGELVSVWHYDRPDNVWLTTTPDGDFDLLETIEDGKAYWFRMTYPMDGTRVLWVWGHEKPVPPAGPAEYPVYLGWNMVGFTSKTAYDAVAYLWNWGAPLPVVYGWTQGDWTVQGWDLVDVAGAEDLVPGQGYWMAFPASGAIYVP